MPLDTDKVRALRAKRGLSQSQAATEAGFKTLQAWSGLEIGARADPRLSTVETIARVLGVGVEDILTTPRRRATRTKPAERATE